MTLTDSAPSPQTLKMPAGPSPAARIRMRARSRVQMKTNGLSDPLTAISFGR